VLRPYQAEAVEQVLASLDRRPILVLPTGAGKTYTAVEVARRVAEMRPGARCLWLAHRRELIGQAAQSLYRAGATDLGIVMAGVDPRPRAAVQVASVQTLARRAAPEGVGLIVCDECHHARATTYQRIFAAYPGVPILGLTATPFRTDGRGLGDVFGEIVVGAWPDDLCRDGTLIEPVVYVPESPDLAGVHVQHGDYHLGELGARMMKGKLVGDIVGQWRRRAGAGDRRRRTVVFAVHVAHSRQLVAAFRAAGIAAEHLDGDTPVRQREALLHRLRTGYTRVVSQCNVLTEGWDLPALEVAVIARPTASLCLHCQMVGRIMRSAPDKAGALVLDHAGNHLRHGTVTQRLDYSLADGAATRPRADAEPAMRRCPECFLLVAPGAPSCPGCGAQMGRSREVRHVPGELVEMGAAIGGEPRPRPPVAVQQAAWDAIEAQREARGFKEGWAFLRFEARFGFRPLVHEGVVCDPSTCGESVRASVYERLVAVAQEKGYKAGWAGYQYKTMFGVWPRRRAAAGGGT
jgi:superfamily II DNA or RNA helicase